jgi:ATP-dependent DNA ligase
VFFSYAEIGCCCQIVTYPQLLDALKLLPAQRAVVDGEIVALDEKGRSSFR